MAPTRPLLFLALLLGFCIAFGFAPNALAEPLDAPIALGSIDTPGEVYGVSVVGTRAYVADGGGGLRVIDSIAIPVPEPGALLLQIAAGATLLGVRARRRRGA